MAIADHHASSRDFSHSQFGTETLSSYGWWRQQDPDSAKGILEMDTLAEDECLAKTSDGVRRFKLPASHHFIALYRSILDETASTPETRSSRSSSTAANTTRPARCWNKPSPNTAPAMTTSATKLLKQITGNWGRFEPAETVPAGVKPKLPLVFRNASNINSNRRAGGHGGGAQGHASTI